MFSTRIITKFKNITLQSRFNTVNNLYFDEFNKTLISKYKMKSYSSFLNYRYENEYHFDVDLMNDNIDLEEINKLRKYYMEKYDIYITLDVLRSTNPPKYANDSNSNIFLL